MTTEKKKRIEKEIKVTNSPEGRVVLMASLLGKQIKNKSAQLENLKKQIKAEFVEPDTETTIKYSATRTTKNGIVQVGVVKLTYKSESRSLDAKKIIDLLQSTNPELAEQIMKNEELYKVSKPYIEVKTDLTEV